MRKTGKDVIQEMIDQQEADTHRVMTPFERFPARIYKSSRSLYPYVIAPARYQGTYEHTLVMAIPVHADSFPREPVGDDLACSTWWENVDRSFIGVGDTPQEAYDDLVDKLLAQPAYERPEGAVKILDLARPDLPGKAVW